MVKYINEAEEELRTSKSWLRDWYPQINKAQPSPDRLDIVYDMYQGDPVISAAINITVDSINESGFRFVSRSGGKPNMREVKKLEKVFEKLDMERNLRNLTYNLLIYGDAFLELVWHKGEIAEAYVLDTPTIEPRNTEHGDLLGYVQTVGNKEKVYFSTEQILHFKFIEIGTRTWGFTPLKPLMTTVATKKFVETHNRTRFQNNAPRAIWIAKTGSDKQIKQLIDTLKGAKEQPFKDIVIQGEIEYRPVNEKESEESYISLLQYLREQILMAMQVPPIMIGLPDNSNRSNSEVQLSAYQRRVHSLQHAIGYSINKALLPLLGNSSLLFKYYPFDKRNEKDDIEIATALWDMGVDEETLQTFLYESGIRLRPGATFERQKLSPTVGGNDGKERKDQPPEHKTGEASETREEQLRTADTFQKYPYVMQE